MEYTCAPFPENDEIFVILDDDVSSRTARPVQIAIGTGIASFDADRPVLPQGHRLTPPEAKSLAFTAIGCKNELVADTVGISIATVRTHLRHVRAKMEVHSVGGAIGTAFKSGMMVVGSMVQSAGLTDYELRVLAGMSSGDDAGGIAAGKHRAQSTVRLQMRSILWKLGLSETELKSGPASVTLGYLMGLLVVGEVAAGGQE